MTLLRDLWTRWFGRAPVVPVDRPLTRPEPSQEEFDAGWQRFANGDPDIEGIARQIGQIK